MSHIKQTQEQEGVTRQKLQGRNTAVLQNSLRTGQQKKPTQQEDVWRGLRHALIEQGTGGMAGWRKLRPRSQVYVAGMMLACEGLPHDREYGATTPRPLPFVIYIKEGDLDSCFTSLYKLPPPPR
jgi:hypothetical protein